MNLRLYPAFHLALAALAASNTAAAAAEPRERADGPIEEVVVISHPLSAEGLALSSDVLAGEELTRKLQSSIGETVGTQPGVHSANFGQAASRPVIHGLSGPRVRIMEDRIDSLDVSVTSADHAVTIEPFIADRIEILKGPSTLLYGSGAIGGVVDVHTGRIPHELSEAAVSGRLEVRGADNANRRTAAGRLDGGAGAVAWHLDGSYRDADDYDIPGYAESAALRAEAAEEEAHQGEEAYGVLPGSDLEQSNLAGGLSWVGDRGFAGIAVSSLDADYGLPGGHEHEEGDDDHDEGDAGAEHAATPSVDLDQTRIDLEAGLAKPMSGFESLNVRVGINDYEHREIEPDGAVATTFRNEAWEARLELTHRPVAGWRGAVGMQVSDRDFSAIGDEAFIAPNETRSAGAFWVGERSLGDIDVEGGLRLGRAKIDPTTADSESYTTYALSLGLVVPFGEAWSLGLLADHTARAPIAEELFSDGPHLATRSFELGNPDLDTERATSLSANLRYAGDVWFFNGTVYYGSFDGFIYEAATGEEQDGFAVFQYAQDDAEFTGMEAELRATVLESAFGQLTLRTSFDTVRARVDAVAGDNLPRIPPSRYGVGADFERGVWRLSLDHTWVRAQSDVAEFELPTDSYHDLRAYLGADVPLGGQVLTVFVQGRNLTDDEQRQNASFIKDTAPLPGRTIEAGVRASF